MAAAFVQAAVANDFGVATVGATFAGSTSTGNLIAAFIWWDTTTNTLTSLTINNGVANFILVDNPTAGGGSFRAAMAYAPNITAGATPTVTANFNAAPGECGIGIMEISGLDTSSPLDQHAINAQVSSVVADNLTSGNVTTVANGEFIFGGTRSEFGTTGVTAGTNFTLDAGGGSHQVSIEHRTVNQAAAGSIAALLTPPDVDQYITGIMTFKIAATAITLTPGAGSEVLHGLALGLGFTINMPDVP